jgi:hypothetical protein
MLYSIDKLHNLRFMWYFSWKWMNEKNIYGRTVRNPVPYLESILDFLDFQFPTTEFGLAKNLFSCLPLRKWVFRD